MSPLDAIARRHCRSAALAVHRRHRRGRGRGPDRGGARTLVRTPRSCSAASAISALAAPLIRGAARPWPSPFERRRRRKCWRNAAGRSACWPRATRFITASARCWRAMSTPAETMVVPAPSAFSLAAARLGWALPNATLVSLHGRALDLRASASAARRARAGADLGWRRARRARAAARRNRLRRLAPDRAGGARRPARAHPRHDGGGLRSRRGRSAQHRGDRGRGRSRARASSRAPPACPTRCSSTTARSPSARCAR